MAEETADNVSLTVGGRLSWNGTFKKLAILVPIVFSGIICLPIILTIDELPGLSWTISPLFNTKAK